MAKYNNKKSYGCILGSSKCISMGNRELTALMVPKLCPLGLLVKVGEGQGRLVASKEGKAMGSGMLEHAVEGRGGGAEFRAWKEGSIIKKF